jgi:hypothetical protein
MKEDRTKSKEEGQSFFGILTPTLREDRNKGKCCKSEINAAGGYADTYNK